MIIVPLTQGYVMWASDQDADLATRFKRHAVKWTRARGVYASRNEVKDGKRRPVTFYREVLGASPGEEVDHKNGVNPPGLLVVDNRRENLRLCSHHKNTCGFKSPRIGTTSKYRGVSWHKASRKWEAGILVNYKKIYLGVFGVEEDAAHAYDDAALQHFGDFAQPNFPKL